MKVGGVLFDMDGLLIDTVPVYAAAMVRAADDVGHAVSREYVLTLVGLLGDELRERMQQDHGASFPVEAFFAAMATRLGEALASSIPLKSGALELVQALSERGVPIAVATSLTRRQAEHHLVQTGLRPYFAQLAARDDVTRGKPHPDVYIEAAARLGREPSDCVALEDSFTGIRAAHAAGAMVIMVPDVLSPTPEIAALCVRVVGDLHEVRGLLAR